MSLTVNPANNRVTSFGFYDADARTVKQNNPRCFYNRSNQRAWKITGSIEEFSLLSAATGAAGEFHAERHDGLPRSALAPATAPRPSDPAAGCTRRVRNASVRRPPAKEGAPRIPRANPAPARS